jgi:hypothetical protein
MRWTIAVGTPAPRPSVRLYLIHLPSDTNFGLASTLGAILTSRMHRVNENEVMLMKRILTALIAAMIISVTALAMSDTADARWGYGGFRGVGYGGFGYRGYGYRGVGFGGYGYRGLGYRYRGFGYAGYGYAGYGLGTAIVVVPTVYYPVHYYYGYSGCGCW